MLAQGAWYIKPEQFCSLCTAPLHPAFSTLQDWEKSLEDLWEQSCSFNTNIYHTPSKDVLQSWCISPLLSFSAAIRSSLPHETTGKCVFLICLEPQHMVSAFSSSGSKIWTNYNTLERRKCKYWPKELMCLTSLGVFFPFLPIPVNFLQVSHVLITDIQRYIRHQKKPEGIFATDWLSFTEKKGFFGRNSAFADSLYFPRAFRNQSLHRSCKKHLSRHSWVEYFVLLSDL